MNGSMKVPGKRLFFRLAVLICLGAVLILLNEQVSSWLGKNAPSAGNRAERSSYYLVDCSNDDSQTLRFVYPLPNSRYFYSQRYGYGE